MTERPPDFEIKRPCEHPLAAGLVFAGLGRFPGSTRYHDSSLYGNTGTLTGMAPATDWVASLGRMCVSQTTEGTGHYVSGTLSGVYPSCTWAAWVYYLNRSGDFSNIVCGSAALAFPGLLTANNARLYITDDGSVDRTINYSSSLPVGSWAHLAIVCSPEVQTVYLNGVANGSGTRVFTPTWNVHKLFSNRNNGQWLTGRIADACLWSRVLSQPEISALADPSNVMLRLGGSDLLRYRPSRSRVFFSGGGAPAVTAIARGLMMGGGIWTHPRRMRRAA